MSPSSNARGLTRLNALSDMDAKAELLRCCGSARWADGMVTRRPFIDEADLARAAREVWFGLENDDWVEAFGHHPRIGDREALRTKFATTQAWAENEQAGTNSASEAILDALARANQVYEERFGYIFIVCATGLSAAEMLERLEGRFDNAADVEITVAAEEQAKITQIRLQKLIGALRES